MMNEVLRRSEVDDSLSGTTGIIAYVKGRDLYVINVGDLWVMMGIEKVDDKGEVVVEMVDLSLD